MGFYIGIPCSNGFDPVSWDGPIYITSPEEEYYLHIGNNYWNSSLKMSDGNKYCVYYIDDNIFINNHNTLVPSAFVYNGRTPTKYGISSLPNGTKVWEYTGYEDQCAGYWPTGFGNEGDWGVYGVHVYIFTNSYIVNTSTTYYYTINVASEDGSPLSNVNVYAYKNSDLSGSASLVTETSTPGRYELVADYSSPTTLYFDARKRGYSYATGSMATAMVGQLTRSASINNAKTIKLKSSAVSYYHVISVENSVGDLVNNIPFRLYKDSSYSIPYTNDNFKYVVNYPLNNNQILEELRDIIGDPDIVGTDLITSVVYDQRKLLTIKNEIQNQFSITGVNITNATTVNDLINYIQSKSTIERPKKIFTTLVDGSGYNGKIVIYLGSYNTVPRNKIYAKGINLPSNYRWNGESSGYIGVTSSQLTPSKTFYVYSSEYTVLYHYNYHITDSCSGEDISDANVVYTSGLNIVKQTTTDANGNVSFNGYYPSLDITISKTGYETKKLEAVSGSIYQVDRNEEVINPNNSVQVVYDDGADTPVAGITVQFFKYNADGTKSSLERYVTNANGYIKKLPDEYFSLLNTIYYIVGNVIGYISINPHIKIMIPYNGESDTEDEYAFEEFNKMSVNSMKKTLKQGNKELKKGTTKKVTYNSDDFRIEILDPDSITTYDIFTSTPVMMYNNKKNVIGSVDVGLKEDINTLKLKVINRYSGNYNPIFKDILFYNNFITKDDNGNYNDLPFSNISFDTSYSDIYGKFGVIKNMWFHKVNDNKDIEIINTLTPYYPLIGQYAIDCRDYNVFESSWDMKHFTRQIDAEHTEPCENIASMKESICMFGSKYLNVPERIEITGFTMGEDTTWNGEWNDDWIKNPDACPGEMMFKEVNYNSVDFYFFFKKRIIRYFYDKLKSEFEKYVSDDFSFGKPGVDDDIREYVEKNVLKLYRLEKVKMFVRRRKKGQHNSKIENDYTKYLEYVPDDKTDKLIPLTKETLGYFKSHGFVEINNMTMTKMNRDDFDRKIVYNLRNGSQEEFGFSFIIKKI